MAPLHLSQEEGEVMKGEESNEEPSEQRSFQALGQVAGEHRMSACHFGDSLLWEQNPVVSLMTNRLMS